MLGEPTRQRDEEARNARRRVVLIILATLVALGGIAGVVVAHAPSSGGHGDHP